jgi:hypothetical protein
MDFSRPDAADPDRFNAILSYGVLGHPPRL